MIGNKISEFIDRHSPGQGGFLQRLVGALEASDAALRMAHHERDVARGELRLRCFELIKARKERDEALEQLEEARATLSAKKRGKP